MKKFYVLTISALFASTSMFAQQRTVTGTPMILKDHITNAGVRTQVDTITYVELFDGTWSPTFYSVTGGGYILGENTYDDKQKAQSFMVGDLHPGSAHYVTGAGIWWGGKQVTSGNPNSKVTVKISKSTGSGTSTSGTVNLAPSSTILGQVDILAAAIDTSNFQWVVFPSPVLIGASENYAISVDFTGLAAGDTAGIVSSADGEFNLPEVVWEQWSDNTWYTLPAAGWGGGTLDLVAYIMATVDFKGASIDENANGVKIEQNYPNPANESTTVSYTLTQASDVNVEVVDILGKVVMSSAQGNKVAGAHKININTSVLAAGTYSINITTEFGKVSNKMVVAR